MLGDEQGRLDGEVCLRGAFLRSHISHKSLTFVLIEPAWILLLIQSAKLESENSSAKDEIFSSLFLHSHKFLQVTKIWCRYLVKDAELNLKWQDSHDPAQPTKNGMRPELKSWLFHSTHCIKGCFLISIYFSMVLARRRKVGRPSEHSDELSPRPLCSSPQVQLNTQSRETEANIEKIALIFSKVYITWTSEVQCHSIQSFCHNPCSAQFHLFFYQN